MKRHAFAASAIAAVILVGTAHAETVEIYLVDMLDNIQNGYCLDISGGQGAQADPANGLQGHTCYSPSGEIFVDQGFASERFAGSVFHMPPFDVCMQAPSTDAGAKLALAACDGSVAQNFAFAGEGAITPASAPDMCLTLGEATRFGRSETNQIKELTLETCSADRAAYLTWSSRTAPE